MTDQLGRWRLQLTIFVALALFLFPACGNLDPDAEASFNAGAAPKGRILYVQNGDVYLWDGDSRRVTEVGDASSPSWGPDGHAFVFVRTWESISDLYLGSVDGGAGEQLTFNKPQLQPGSKAFVDSSVWALDPVWSSSTNSIAYVSDLGTTRNFLWLMRGPGASPVQVAGSTFNGQNVEDPDFSPDGTQIVFAQRMSGDSDLQRWTDLFVVNLNSGQLRPLVQGGEGNYDASWSPDGNWIAFVKRTGTTNDLWVVPADGGEPIQLTDGRQIASPSWSPDGNSIAFFELDGGKFRVSYVNLKVGANGGMTAEQPERLFSADHLDAPSGLSWIN